MVEVYDFDLVQSALVFRISKTSPGMSHIGVAIQIVIEWIFGKNLVILGMDPM